MVRPQAARSGVRPWLTLMRPANVVTAWSDVLAGFAVASAVSVQRAPDLSELSLLLLSTTGLYAGGVVLNDVFDAALDAEERPERPIPSGLVSRRAAAVFGAVLLTAGIVLACLVNATAGVLAAAIAALAVLYDARGKHHTLLGPLNMGMCRAGNLLLGMAAVPVAVGVHAYLGILPLAYIAAVTAVSRGEVHGGSRAAGITGLALLAGLAAAFVFMAIRATPMPFQPLPALPFLTPFFGVVFVRFWRAAHDRDATSIRKAVKTGVLFLILLNASVAAGFGGFGIGLATVALLPISLGLSRLYAVT